MTIKLAPVERALSSQGQVLLCPHPCRAVVTPAGVGIVRCAKCGSVLTVGEPDWDWFCGRKPRLYSEPELD